MRLSNVISAVRSRAQSVVRSVSARIGGLFQHERGGGVRVEVHNLGDTVGTSAALADLVVSGSYGRAELEIIADRAVRALQDAVAPISRTGKLRDSFGYRFVSDNEVIVYSTAPYARRLLDPNAMATPSSVDDLVKWMRTKSEFSGLDDKNVRRVAFAISRSIRTGGGRGRTGRSDISRLSPSGERAYNYVEVALRNLAAESSDFNIDLSGVL